MLSCSYLIILIIILNEHRFISGNVFKLMSLEETYKNSTQRE